MFFEKTSFINLVEKLVISRKCNSLNVIEKCDFYREYDFSRKLSKTLSYREIKVFLDKTIFRETEDFEKYSSPKDFEKNEVFEKIGH